MRPWLDDPGWVQRVLYFFKFYQKGEYPEGGTYYDQSARFLTLMGITEAAYEAAKEVKRQRS